MGKIKKILGSVVFLTGLVVIFLVLSVIVEPQYEIYNIIEVEKKLAALEKEDSNSIDVIIVGDSETYSAYIPLQIWEEQGITSYVCGTNAQRLCDTYSILKSGFETQSPKLVVLEANCLFRYAGMNQQSEPSALDEAGKLFPILQYHNKWKQAWTLVDTSEQRKQELESDRKGFKLRTDSVPYTGGEWMNETDKRKKFGDEVEDYLERIQELCFENNAELVLVSTPSPKNWNYAKHNTVNDWALKNDVNYLDMNLTHEEIQIDWANDTRDGGDHLNYEGAQKLSTYFGNYLKEIFELTDHREDEK